MLVTCRSILSSLTHSVWISWCGLSEEDGMHKLLCHFKLSKFLGKGEMSTVMHQHFLKTYAERDVRKVRVLTKAVISSASFGVSHSAIQSTSKLTKACLSNASYCGHVCVCVNQILHRLLLSWSWQSGHQDLNHISINARRCQTQGKDSP